MGQVAEELKNRQNGSLPSNIEAPKNVGNLGRKQRQAMKLRSGKPMMELWCPEKKPSMTQTPDNSYDQLNSQPSTNQSTDLTKEHQSTTQEK